MKSKRRSKRASQGSSDSSEAPLNQAANGQGERWRSLRSYCIQIGLVAFIAFLLRLTHVLQTFDVPTVRVLLGDASGYFQWAQRIAGGNWYGTETFYQAPLYPYTLAMIFSVFGESVFAVRCVQAAWGATSVFLIGVAAREMFDRKVGFVSAVLLAIYPPAIFYDGIIQKASLASLLLCALMVAIAHAQMSERQTTRRWVTLVLMGSLLGLLVLTRENALLWLPLFPIWLLWSNWGRSPRVHAIELGAFVFGAAVVLLPVAARNAALGGEWSPTTFQAGPNFYIGNNSSADGTYRPLVPGHETPVYERSDAVDLAEQAVGRAMSSREVSRYWLNRSVEDIAADPMRWSQLMVQKCLMVINHFEVPDVESMEIYSNASSALSLMHYWHFGLLGPLAVLGFCLLPTATPRNWIWYGLTALMVFAVALFFVLGRYRLPVAILLMPWAAAGCVNLVRALRDHRLRPTLVASTFALMTLIVCHLPVHDESGLNSSVLMNAGVASAQRGDLTESLQLLNRAAVMNPNFAEIQYNLGRVWLEKGHRRQALSCFRRALELDPSLTQAGEAILFLNRDALPSTER